MRRRSPAAVLLLLLACWREPAGPALKDDLGRTVTLSGHVHRVVTLAPNLTEIVFAIGAGDKLVGTDDFSDAPAAARKLPKVGGLQPNVERIASLKPDLVIATTTANHPALATALGNIGVPLFVVRTDRLSEIPTAMNRLGQILDAPASAGAASSIRAAITRQRRRRPHSPRVLFAVWTNPLYVAGHDTFADDLFILSGAANAVPPSVHGWPQYSLESLVAAPPDLMLYPRTSVTRAQINELLHAAPSLRKKTRFVPVDENTFTRPGPRVVEAAAGLNEILDAWERKH
jgi:iron complex transport system substrate-binding protein